MASDSAYAITASAMRDYSYETTNDEIKKKACLGLSMSLPPNYSFYDNELIAPASDFIWVFDARYPRKMYGVRIHRLR